MIRLALEGALSDGRPVELPAEQAHYLLAVMRLSPGAELLAFNGRDGEWLCRLESAGRRSARLLPLRPERPQPPPPDLELAVALIRRSRLETIIEKAVELGVGRVRLLTTRRVNFDRPNLGRLAAIAREAAEQTGRLEIPDLAGPLALDDYLGTLEPPRRLVFCDEAGEDPSAPWGGPSGRAPPLLEALAAPAGAAGPFAVLIGPEGGFDPEERARLRARADVTPVSLGPRILRADTAAIAALALLQAGRGDWR